MKKLFQVLFITAISISALSSFQVKAYMTRAEQVKQLWEAIYQNDIASVQQLLKGPPVGKIRDSSYDTPLHLAVKRKLPEIAQLLIENGADVNAKDGYGFGYYNTPLHLAVKRKLPEIAQLLIENGADVNAKGGYGETPLHLAVRNKLPEIAQLLIENKAYVNAKDGYDNTPLHLAVRNKLPEIAQLLIENKADVHAKNRDMGDTPLHLAVRNKLPEIAQLLIENGADVNAKNRFGRTPYDKTWTEWFEPLMFWQNR